MEDSSLDIYFREYRGGQICAASSGEGLINKVMGTGRSTLAIKVYEERNIKNSRVLSMTRNRFRYWLLANLIQ